MSADSIVTQLPQDFLREFADEILGTIPQEKVQMQLKEAEIGRVLAAEGSLRSVQGLGQKLGEVPARLWFRWRQQYPGCWEDDAFVQEFFADNERLKAHGWKPKASSLRHGVTFSGGVATSNLRNPA